jgi:hypothetical protein
MQSWTTVTSPDMRMSLWNPSAYNGVMRNLLRQVAGLALPSMTDAVCASFSACLEVHKSALNGNHSDILVGSSWGGALVLALLASGDWEGPACIMCPALALIESYVQSLPDGCSSESIASALANLPDQRKAAILLVHGTADTTVPIGMFTEIKSQCFTLQSKHSVPSPLYIVATFEPHLSCFLLILS